MERIAIELARVQWCRPSMNGKVRDRETALLVKDLLHYSRSRTARIVVSALVMTQYGCEVAAGRTPPTTTPHCPDLTPGRGTLTAR